MEWISSTQNFLGGGRSYLLPTAMATANIQPLVLTIDSFLAKRMIPNNKTEEEIKAMRETECIEVTVHGQDTEKVSIEGLEDRFQQQSVRRITIPNQDILQWKASFPLHETSEELLTQLSHQYKEWYKQGGNEDHQRRSKD